MRGGLVQVTTQLPHGAPPLPLRVLLFTIKPFLDKVANGSDSL